MSAALNGTYIFFTPVLLHFSTSPLLYFSAIRLRLDSYGQKPCPADQSHILSNLRQITFTFKIALDIK